MTRQIGFFVLFCCALFGVEHVYLKTPNIARENFIGTNVGIRPVRPVGVRLEAEWIRDKLIIHNYGYGWCGLSLCWGGAQEVLDILGVQRLESKTVAILGAGVAGLATAYTLLEEGYEVHIYSEAWSPNLTSDVATGIWGTPLLPVDASEETRVLHQRLVETSKMRHLNSVGDHPEFRGIRVVPSYNFNAGSVKGEEIVVHFDNGVVKAGRKTEIITMDGKLFIADLFSKVKAKGAVLVERHFEDIEDILSLEETTIINCTSLGSRKLFNDQEFLPVRGQVAYFKPQEGVDFILSQNVPNNPVLWVCINSWSDRIIVAGSSELFQEEAVNIPQVIDQIIANAEMCLSGQL